jgi:adenylosuccinate lyase
MRCWETGEELRGLIAADPEIMKRIRPAELARVFDLKVHFKDVNRTFRAVGL